MFTLLKLVKEPQNSSQSPMDFFSESDKLDSKIISKLKTPTMTKTV